MLNYKMLNLIVSAVIYIKNFNIKNGISYPIHLFISISTFSNLTNFNLTANCIKCQIYLVLTVNYIKL